MVGEGDMRLLRLHNDIRIEVVGHTFTDVSSPPVLQQNKRKSHL